MTAQVSDAVIFRRARYSLAEFDGEGLVDPSRYGVEPKPTTSANWRGFVCEYKVYRGQLKLSWFSINITKAEMQTLCAALNLDYDPDSVMPGLGGALSDIAVDIQFCPG